MELSLILSYLRPYRLHLVGALLSVALFTLEQLVVPWNPGSTIIGLIRSDSISLAILHSQLLQTPLLTGAAEFIAAGLMLTGIVIALFGLQWKLALVVCAVIPLVFIIARLVGREIQQGAGRAQRHIADLASTIKEAFTGALVIRAFTQEERQLARFREENRQATQASLRISKLLASQEPVVTLLAPPGGGVA